MPSSVNGIGTTYFGKKNAHSYRGVCESCGRETMLEDYETGYYFCIIFIPIIPLGKKQIIGYCHSCTRHRSIPLAEFQQIREDSIAGGMEQLAANKDDPTAALDLLGTLSAFNQHDQAAELANATEKSHRDNIDVQISLGSWYEEAGSIEDANRCFDRAYEIDPSHPGAIRAYGIGLLEQGKTDEARAVLEQLAPPSPHYDPTVFFLLGSAYQANDRHQEALELFNLVRTHTPEFAKEKAFKKAVKKSEKEVR